MIIMIFWMVGWMILLPCCMIYGMIKGIKGSKVNKTTYSRKQNSIDKHGDNIYGTIDWLREGKL